MTIAEQLKQQGMQQGIEQGLHQGRQEGEQLALHKVAFTLYGQGMPIDNIALITGLTTEQIQKIINSKAS